MHIKYNYLNNMSVIVVVIVMILYRIEILIKVILGVVFHRDEVKNMVIE
jgi:hypothetical protein